MVEKVKIKFVGIYELYYKLPLFCGRVKPNEIIETTKECWEKGIKTHKDWELVQKTKKGDVK